MRSPRAVRPVAALFLTLMLAGTACGDDDATGGSTAPPATTVTTVPGSTTGVPTSGVPAPEAGCVPPADLPDLVVANGTEVVVVAGGESRTLATFDDEVWLAFGDGRDLVVAGTRVGTGPESKSQTWVVDGDEQRELTVAGSPGTVLYEVGETDGSLAAIYGAIFDYEAAEPAAARIHLTPLDGRASRELGEAYSYEYGVTTASMTAEFATFTAVSDLTEVIRTVDLQQPDVDAGRFAPQPEYAKPPFVSDGVLRADGTELLWVEGPDSDAGEGTGPTVPPQETYELVVADARTGEERFRREIGGASTGVLRVEWDGDAAIVSRFDEPPLVVDTNDVDMPLREACGIEGVVTLTRPRR